MHCSSARNTITTGDASLHSLVKQYIAEHQPKALQERKFFEGMSSVELAIHHAAFALDHRNKRYSHQCCISLAPMQKAHEFLLRSKNDLPAMASFNEIHTFLESSFSKIRGIGVLYTYDTALRLGFFFGLEPTSVYLHAGTKDGARVFGFSGARVVSVERFPAALRVLPAHEIENFLCIFNRVLNANPSFQRTPGAAGFNC